MAESPQELEAEELTDAIEQNPEAVAEFVSRLDRVNELLDVLELGTSAMDDEMVMRLAGTGSTLAESADAMATDETVRLAEAVGRDGDELADAMATVAELQRDGTLDDLAALSDLLALANGALDDEMVMRLAGTGTALGEVADTAAEPDTVRGLDRMLNAVGDASTEDADPVGALGLVKATRDPEVKRGLGYLVAIARALGSA
ncbi:DUF1641 domain-containing protein [Haloarchaeobius iranensis]|uniref:Uncharacterized conserved protein YjgD, DUF1641 family n=1 Tax=Haloarchaeobius iranensis TaxID=996166 RepID=A0A1G9SAF3_9EURY|nr:DUF1641 domain-containing protein [Haloarchaeobius iranensis]SDM32372.1 Uncharacterized conserved protein YjgD, DUF1641 family [Haloarchaeobius iranensis]